MNDNAPNTPTHATKPEHATPLPSRPVAVQAAGPTTPTTRNANRNAQQPPNPRTAPTEPADPIPSKPVLVAPRVLDENAYAHFADSIRQLLDLADARAAAASNAASELAETERKLGKLATRQREHLELASRVLHAIDGHNKTAQQHPAPHEIESRVKNELEATVSALVEQRTAAVHAAIEQTVAVRLDTLEHTLTAAPVPQADQALIAELIDERLDALEAMVAARLDARIDQVKEQLAEFFDTRISAASATLEREKAALKGLLTTADGAKRALDQAVQAAEAEQFAALAALVSRAQTVINGGDGSPSLAELTAKAEHAAQHIDIKHEQTEDAKATLAALNDAVRNADDAARRLDATLPELRRATDNVAPLTERADDTLAALRDTLATATGNAELASHQSDHLADMITAGEFLLTRLEPWRPLMTGEATLDNPHTIPPALAGVLRGIEHTVGELSATLAESMRSAVTGLPARAEPAGASPTRVRADRGDADNR